MISNFQKNETVNLPLLVAKAEIKETTTKKNYANLTLMDSSGEINAKIWNTDTLKFKEGDVINIKAKVEEYNGVLQLNIVDYSESDEPKEKFFKSSPYPTNVLKAQIKRYIDIVTDTDCKDLLNLIFDKYDLEGYPAASNVHHNYYNGLLEHTMHVTANAISIANNYQNINTNLVITAALLHDIGKIYELTKLPTIEYTENGNLIGHIVKGSLMLNEEMTVLHFPEDKKEKILHCILSHRGKLEYGSPKVPCLKEAIIINFADDIDAKLKLFDEELNKNSSFCKYAGTKILSGKFNDLDFS